MWRWDQGRLEYFAFEVIRNSAKVLWANQGVHTGPSAGDLLRRPLIESSGRPFLPQSLQYAVWRNYGRVFGLQLLAAKVDERLVCTQLCQRLSEDDGFTSDEYIGFLVRRFYYPAPMFEDYDRAAKQTFPMAAALKYLLVSAERAKPFVTVEEVADYLVGNGVTGSESISFYRSLQPSGAVLRGDQLRQLRELLIFLSQATFLKWDRPRLFLDADGLNTEFQAQLLLLASPEMRPRLAGKAEEILNMGRVDGAIVQQITWARIEESDDQFIEGQKVRSFHLRSERSTKLREIFLARSSNRSTCNMCSMDTRLKYPWTDTLLEIHHLLPLGSPLYVDSRMTSLRDLVGVCPTCHRATHLYYKHWLKGSGQKDFASKEQAHQVYEEARGHVAIIH